MADIYADAEDFLSQSDRSEEDFHVQPTAGPQAGSIASLLNPEEVRAVRNVPLDFSQARKTRAPKIFTFHSEHPDRASVEAALNTLFSVYPVKLQEGQAFRVKKRSYTTLGNGGGLTQA